MTSRPLKVLHVVSGIENEGGVMSFVRRIAAVDAAGVENYIWKHRDFAAVDTCRYVREGKARYTDHGLASDLYGAFEDLVPLIGWARKQQRLTLHAHSRTGIFVSLMASLPLRIPLMIQLHGLARRPAAYRQLWQICRAKPIFNSFKTCRHYGCDPATSLIVMPPLAWPESARKRRVGVLRFVACGMFVRGKHFDVLINGFLRVLQQGIAAELHIYGLSSSSPDPRWQNEILSLAKTSPFIYLHEWDPRWSEYLAADDIFVHLGFPESFGMVMLEAFAHGCKLVVLRGTFLDELASPLNTQGIYASEEFSPAAVARQMRTAALAGRPDSSELWASRRQVRSLFSAEAARRKLAQSYQKD